MLDPGTLLDVSASLAIAERLDVLGCDVDALLDDLLSHVAPD